MNSIQTRKKNSIYPIYDVPYDDIYIDGLSIDELLDSENLKYDTKGLVPSISGWLLDKEDEKETYKRIVPSVGKIEICPILICPDDQDFFCTTIVVEIENCGTVIKWNRFGINLKFEFRKYEMIGLEVEWFENIGKMEFSIEEYMNVISIIRENNLTIAST